MLKNMYRDSRIYPTPTIEDYNPAKARSINAPVAPRVFKSSRFVDSVAENTKDTKLKSLRSHANHKNTMFFQ